MKYTSQPISGQHQSLYPIYALFILLLISISNYVDRQIISILAEQIKIDLRVGDQQLGVLYGTSFAIFFALFGIPLGRLADGWRRGRLLALGLTLWSLMTVASGLSGSFGQLAAARMGVGIGEASAVPAAYSLLGDYFTRKQRGFVLSIYMSGAHIGSGLSLALGGWVLQIWALNYAAGAAPFGLAGWQAAFLIAGIPGLALAVWALSLREPARGAGEGLLTPIVREGVWGDFLTELAAIVPPFTLWTAARQRGGLLLNILTAALIAALASGLIWVTGDVLQWVTMGIGCYSILSWIQSVKHRDPPTYALTWGQPIVVIATLAFGTITMVTNTAGFWLSPYAMRTFHVSAGVVGAAVGLPGAAAAVAGVVVGGLLSDALKARDPRGRIWVCALSMLGSAITINLAFLAHGFAVYALIVPFALFVGNMWLGPAVATLQDVVLPRMRGIAAATSSIGSTMVGFGLGPYLSGKISGLTGSLKTGVLSLYLILPVSLLLFWLISRRIGDLEATRVARAVAAGEVIAPGCDPP